MPHGGTPATTAQLKRMNPSSCPSFNLTVLVLGQCSSQVPVAVSTAHVDVLSTSPGELADAVGETRAPGTAFHKFHISFNHQGHQLPKDLGASSSHAV